MAWSKFEALVSQAPARTGLIALNSLGNLPSLDPLLSEQDQKALRSGVLCSRTAHNYLLLTENNRNPFNETGWLIFAPFISCGFLKDLLSDGRVHSIVYVPWMETELDSLKLARPEAIAL